LQPACLIYIVVFIIPHVVYNRQFLSEESMSWST